MCCDARVCDGCVCVCVCDGCGCVCVCVCVCDGCGCVCVCVWFQKPLFAPKSKPEKNHWTFRDVAKMAQLVGTHPVMLDADAS